jgi:hypothetical protein
MAAERSFASDVLALVFTSAASAMTTGGAAGAAALDGFGPAAAGGEPESATVPGGVKVGISCSVRVAIITATVDSSTAAAAAIGQRRFGATRAIAIGAAASRGPSCTWRAAAASIAARVAADGRSSSASLAAW